MTILSRSMRLATFVLATLFLSACSSGKLVKTYEGDLDKSQVATLKAPESVDVLRVNGKKVPTYLMSQLAINYGLKPGRNVVVFKYSTVWAQPKSGQDVSKPKVVESPEKQFVLNARAGEVYHFEVPVAANVREAEKLALNFHSELLDGQGSVIAQSTDYKKPLAQKTVAGNLNAQAPLAGAAVGSIATGSSATAISGAGSLPANEAIKVLWQTLSADQKKEFLKWAFQ